VSADSTERRLRLRPGQLPRSRICLDRSTCSRAVATAWTAFADPAATSPTHLAPRQISRLPMNKSRPKAKINVPQRQRGRLLVLETAPLVQGPKVVGVGSWRNAELRDMPERARLASFHRIPAPPQARSRAYLRLGPLPRDGSRRGLQPGGQLSGGLAQTAEVGRAGQVQRPHGS
jgi:hypothetical protein